MDVITFLHKLCYCSYTIKIQVKEGLIFATVPLTTYQINIDLTIQYLENLENLI